MPAGPDKHEESFQNLNRYGSRNQNINILLLGQTGVGKTTFINTFANYLVSDTLAEAVGDKMQVVIPSAFPFTDPHNFKEKMIVMGTPDEYEQLENAGESSTQQCRSFVFPIGDRNLRFIDTPGIGDTRGLEQDTKNFQEILAYIAQYEHLNGICILMKPNEERLNILFRFCVNELLRHLHVSARENLIFIFTNSRSTFFAPGTTKRLLHELLDQYRIDHNVEIPFSKENIFLFDNEGFRYLALRKNNVQLDDEQAEIYMRSWTTSVKECCRLIKYISTRPLLTVCNRLSLNEAKQLIRKLPRPIAETAKSIEQNIQLATEYRKRVLENPNITLPGIPQNKIIIVLLEHPRTVCTSEKCCRVMEVGAETKIEYPHICHDECYVKGVVQETRNDLKLQQCEMMDAKNGASTISSTMGNKELCRDEIDKRISELREEKRIVQHVYVDLVKFLHANVILPINDDNYIDYVQSIIHEEQIKQNAGAHNRDIIVHLEKIMAEYKNAIQVFKESIQNQRAGGEEVELLKVEDVFTMLDTLYRLRINGEQIREQVEAQETSEKRSLARHEKCIEMRQTVGASKVMLQISTLFPNNPSSDTLPVVFTIGVTISFPVNIEPNLFEIVKCATDEEFNVNIANAIGVFCVVSPNMPSKELLSNNRLLKYYFLVSAKSMSESNFNEDAKLTHVSSNSYLLNELCNDLSQYYNSLAHRAFTREKDHMKGKRLFVKSKRCQEILLNETEKALKPYAGIYNNANLNVQTSSNSKSE